MVVDPLRALRQIGRSASFVEMVVDVETNCLRLPLDCVDVKIVGVLYFTGERVELSDALVTTVSRAVDRTVDEIGLLADVFHDVDLAALRPLNFLDIGAEHPEGRPQALSAGNLNARLETSISLREFALRLEARGGIVARDLVCAGVFFRESFDDE